MILCFIGLKAVEVIELCQGARGTGPADCFAESRSLGSNAERTHLCNGASSAVSIVYGSIV